MSIVRHQWLISGLPNKKSIGQRLKPVIAKIKAKTAAPRAKQATTKVKALTPSEESDKDVPSTDYKNSNEESNQNQHEDHAIEKHVEELGELPNRED